MGTPDRFRKVEADLRENNIYQKNYLNKQKVLFIDRDDTLIRCKKGDYILLNSPIYYLDENIKKIAFIAEHYDFVCMITNQPQISMGLMTIKELDIINSLIINYCLSIGLKIDVVSFCPHHPHHGYDNEVSFLKIDCFCRKPNPGLFLEQSFLRNIDLNNSLMIGDSESDLIASRNAGCQFKHVNNL